MQRSQPAEFFPPCRHPHPHPHLTKQQNGKPAPDCFTKVAQRLGLPPSACLVIEDAPAGVTAAVAAGMRVVAVPSILQKGGRPSDQYPRPCPGATAGCISLLPSLLDFRPEDYGLPAFTGGWEGGRGSCPGVTMRMGVGVPQVCGPASGCRLQQRPLKRMLP